MKIQKGNIFVVYIYPNNSFSSWLYGISDFPTSVLLHRSKNTQHSEIAYQKYCSSEILKELKIQKKGY